MDDTVPTGAHTVPTGKMQQLPENRAVCTGMPHEFQQNKKNQLPGRYDLRREH